MTSDGGAQTKLHVHGIEIRNYRTAIAVDSSKVDRQKWNGGMRIEHNRFVNIGQFDKETLISYAVIGLNNSRGNTISNNTFRNFQNIDLCGALHAIYLAHWSTDNVVKDNIFEDTCSDTIKVRDASNNNKIAGNTMTGNNGTVIFVDSFCDRRKTRECNLPRQECPSWENEFIDNDTTNSQPTQGLFRIRGDNSIPGCDIPQATQLRTAPEAK